MWRPIEFFYIPSFTNTYSSRSSVLIRLLLEERETFDAGLLQEEEAEAKRRWSAPNLSSPRLRMDHGCSTVELSDTRSFGRTVSAGWVSKPTWATTRKLTTQSVPPSLGR